eukprot:2624359-Amphidinium_carterae.1
MYLVHKKEKLGEAQHMVAVGVHFSYDAPFKTTAPKASEHCRVTKSAYHCRILQESKAKDRNCLLLRAETLHY